jgi:hypothetical protein
MSQEYSQDFGDEDEGESESDRERTPSKPAWKKGGGRRTPEKLARAGPPMAEWSVEQVQGWLRGEGAAAGLDVPGPAGLGAADRLKFKAAGV